MVTFRVLSHSRGLLFSCLHGVPAIFTGTCLHLNRLHFIRNMQISKLNCPYAIYLHVYMYVFHQLRIRRAGRTIHRGRKEASAALKCAELAGCFSIQMTGSWWHQKLACSTAVANWPANVASTQHRQTNSERVRKRASPSKQWPMQRLTCNNGPACWGAVE